MFSGSAQIAPAIPQRPFSALAPGWLSIRFWSLSLLWLVAFVVCQSFLFWLHLPYDQTPDQDFILAYNALLLNSGLAQEYFDHTGYAQFLLLAPWFELLGGLGFLPVDSLEALPSTADINAFDVTWQSIIEAGRLLTTVVVAGFALAFALFTARLFDDRRIGFFAGLALASGAGAISQIGLMRTEPLSAFLVVAAILLAALAAKKKRMGGRLLLLGLGSFLGVLAVLAKVFAFIPLVAAPPIAVAFGTMAVAPPQPPSIRRLRATLMVAAAIMIGIPGGTIVWTGLSSVEAAIFDYQPFAAGPLALYQGLFAIWVLVCVGAYALLWRVSLADTLSAVAALTIGTSLGLAVLWLRYDLQNVIAAIHPIEHMFVFSTWSDPTLGEQSTVLGGTLLTRLLENAQAVIAMRFARPANDNLFLIELWVVAALLIGCWANDRRWMWQAGLLLLVSLAMQTVFLLRYTLKTYHIYSDPLTILAAAVALARFRGFLSTRSGSVLVIGWLLAYVILGLRSELVQSSVCPADPTGMCDAHERLLTRLEPFPFCPDVLVPRDHQEIDD